MKMILVISIVSLFQTVNGQIAEAIDSIRNEFNNEMSAEEQALFYREIGYFYEDLDSFDLAIKNKLSSCKLLVGLNRQEAVAKLLKSIGRDYYKLENYPVAMEFYIGALRIFENIGYRGKSLGYLYHYIGSVYKRENLYYKAYSYYKKEYEYGLKTNSLSLRAEGLNLMGQVIGELTGDYQNALLYHFEALHLYDSLGIENRKILVYSNIAEIYKALEQDSLALTYELKTLDYYRREGSSLQLFAALINTASICNNFFAFKESLNLLEEAAMHIGKFKRNENRKLSDYYYELWRAYEGIGDYEKALKSYEKHVAFEARILNNRTIQSIEEVEVKYQTEKKEERIKSLEFIKEKQEKIAHFESVVILVVGIAFVTILFFAFFLLKKTRIIEGQRKAIENNAFILEETNKLLEQKNRAIIDSIQYAKNIQNAILPSPKLLDNFFKESFILYRPKDIVAGDFYWLETHENKVFYAVADCTGHGVPGAMMSVLCSNILSHCVTVLKVNKPSEILEAATGLLEEHFAKSEKEIYDGMELAICCLDLVTGTLQYSGANSPLYYTSAGKLKEIKGEAQPVGRFCNRKSFINHTIDVQPGDCFYMFSDGYKDQFGGPKSKKFMTRRFKQLLERLYEYTMEDQKKNLEHTFECWKGDLEQIDDVCVLGVRV